MALLGLKTIESDIVALIIADTTRVPIKTLTAAHVKQGPVPVEDIRKLDMARDPGTTKYGVYVCVYYHHVPGAFAIENIARSAQRFEPIIDIGAFVRGPNTLTCVNHATDIIENILDMLIHHAINTGALTNGGELIGLGEGITRGETEHVGGKQGIHSAMCQVQYRKDGSLGT